jgi:uncharacterized membrane-anchored protein YjiN (DUF445 family)
LARSRTLKRINWLASGILVASLAVLVVAKLLERHSAGFGFLAAFAEAATIGGLADWYAVVVLFRRPFGLPIPHTAIIPANHRQIADRLGNFIETHFLAPGPIGAKLRQVDFASAASEWLRDPERSDGLAHFILRLLPETLRAVEDSGLRSFLARRIGDKILDEIDAAIRLRDRVLLILSEYSIHSDWVEDEVTAGFEEERKRGQIVLFPVRLDEAVMNTKEAWAAKLRARLIGDFQHWKDHDAYKRSFERVLRDLTIKP